MIGDTPHDAEAGLEASTSAGGVLTGGLSRTALTEAGCFVVAEDLLSLLFKTPITTADSLAERNRAGISSTKNGVALTDRETLKG